MSLVDAADVDSAIIEISERDKQFNFIDFNNEITLTFSVKFHFSKMKIITMVENRNLY